MPKRQIKGTVSSAKMNSTVVVSVEMPKRHPIYKKLTYSTKKFKARDTFDSQEGEVVLIEECPPFSKTVTWKVIQNFSKEDK